MGTVKLFISYSHKDELLREEFVSHLSGLDGLGVVKKWCDRDVLPGEELENKIDENLNDADIILLLVSSSFYHSPYCRLEMGRALERREKEGTKVVPIRLRPFDWKGTPLMQLKALPQDAVPVTLWRNMDEAFANVTMGIRLIAEEILESQKKAKRIHPSTQAKNSEATSGYGLRFVDDVATVRNSEESETIRRLGKNLSLLKDEERLRYFELAVFPNDVSVPLPTLQTLWAKTGSLNGETTRSLIARLQELSLIDYDNAGELIRIHNLIRLHLIRDDNDDKGDPYHDPRLPFVHGQLLDAHKPPSRRWSDLTDAEPYLWQHLAFHLKEAGEGEELIRTVKDWQYLAKKTRLRTSSEIDTDLAIYEEIDPSNRKLRTIQLMYKNFHHLFDRWAHSEGVESRQFALSRTLDDVNSILEEHARHHGITYLTLNCELPDSTVNVRRCRFSHDGDWVVSTTDEGPLFVWETKSGTLSYRLTRLAPYDDNLKRRRIEIDGHEQEVRSCDFGAGSKLIVSASADQTVKVWSLKLRDVIRTLLTDNSIGNDCRFSPNGKLIVSALDNGTLKLWDVEDNKPATTLKDSKAINCCAFGNNGQWIISGSCEGTLEIWDVESLKRLDALPGHLNAINDCSFSEQAGKLASASADGTINIWNADSRDAPTHTLRGHSAGVNGCSFSRDGRLLVSASSDRTLKVWDVETGQCKTTFVTDGEMFCCAAYGDIVVAGGVRGVYFLRLLSSVQGPAIDSTKSRYLTGIANQSVAPWPNSMKVVSSDLNSRLDSVMTDPTGRTFLSYRRTRVDEIALLVAALHDRGVPTWQDLSDLGTGQAEENLRKVLSDPMISSGILWLTPDIADSAMIRRCEMPEILRRARHDVAFFALLVAAGKVDYDRVAELGRGYVTYDLGSFNITKVTGDPTNHLEAARIARLVLRERIEKLHRHLPLDEPLVVNIYSYTPPPFQAGRALIIDWTQRFVGGRTALSGAWEGFLLPALRDIVEAIQTQAPERAVEITGLLSLPGAVALGCTFLEPRGIKISWRPRQAPNQFWNIKEPRQSSGFVSTLMPDTLSGEDLAVLVSVDNNVKPAFTSSKPLLAARFRAIAEVLNPSLVAGVTRYEINTPGQAADIAFIVRQAIITARNQHPEMKRTHLFMAVPVGLAMMIGQLMNTCGLIQTYEYHADNNECRYQPSVLLNPTW